MFHSHLVHAGVSWSGLLGWLLRYVLRYRALALSMLLLLPCSKVLPLAIWSKIAHRAVVRRKGGRKGGIPLSFVSKTPEL